MTQCPACGRNYHNSVFPLHYECCLHRPEVDEAVRVAITDAEHPGYALGRKRYDRVARTVSSRALAREYGTWQGVCAHFGLRPSSTRPPKRDRTNTRKRRPNLLDAPLTPAERNACTRRGYIEAEAGYVHSPLRSVVAR